MLRPVVLGSLVVATSMGALSLSAGAQAPQSFTAKTVRIDGMVGTLDVQVGTGAAIGYSISGDAEAIKDVTAAVEGDTLVINQKDPKSSWFMWFQWNSGSATERVKISLTVPSGTPLDIDGLVGKASIGDINAPLKMDLAAAEVTVGAVTSAEIDAAGSGEITIASVKETLDLEIAGSGEIHVGSAGAVKADIAGSGELVVGTITGPLSVEIAGSGDVKVDSVAGDVSFSSAGSGDLSIKSGKATAFKVEIMGSGSVNFAGEAVNPNISLAGSGDIWVKSYSGSLNTSGVGEVRTDNGELRIE